jgi:hypothetical protein
MLGKEIVVLYYIFVDNQWLDNHKHNGLAILANPEFEKHTSCIQAINNPKMSIFFLLIIFVLRLFSSSSTKITRHLETSVLSKVNTSHVTTFQISVHLVEKGVCVFHPQCSVDSHNRHKSESRHPKDHLTQV